MNPSTDPKHLVLVHKEGEPGSLQIDYMTGGIVTPVDDRPDWAEGLTNALPREREAFYKTRLGEDHVGTPEALAFEDLSWIGVDGEGELLEISADVEFRQSVLLAAFGYNEETEAFEKGGKVLAEVEIAADNLRTTEEAGVIDETLSTGFGAVNHAENNQKVSGA